MPFYLITYRTVVEAESDRHAALKALEKLGNGASVTLEVKFDESTTTHVVIPARIAEEVADDPDGGAAQGDPQVAEAHTPTPEEAEAASGRPETAPARFGRGTILIIGLTLICLPLLALLFASP